MSKTLPLKAAVSKTLAFFSIGGIFIRLASARDKGASLGLLCALHYSVLWSLLRSPLAHIAAPSAIHHPTHPMPMHVHSHSADEKVEKVVPCAFSLGHAHRAAPRARWAPLG